MVPLCSNYRWITWTTGAMEYAEATALQYSQRPEDTAGQGKYRLYQYVLQTQQTFVLVKTYWRRLQCDIFLSSKTSWRHNCKTSCKHALKTPWKTSWRRLENVLKTSCKTSSRHFRKTYYKYVFKTSWKTKSVTLKPSSRRLEDVLENKKCLLGIWKWDLPDLLRHPICNPISSVFVGCTVSALIYL